MTPPVLDVDIDVFHALLIIVSGIMQRGITGLFLI